MSKVSTSKESMRSSVVGRFRRICAEEMDGRAKPESVKAREAPNWPHQRLSSPSSNVNAPPQATLPCLPPPTSPHTPSRISVTLLETYSYTVRGGKHPQSRLTRSREVRASRQLRLVQPNRWLRSSLLSHRQTYNALLRLAGCFITRGGHANSAHSSYNKDTRHRTTSHPKTSGEFSRRSLRSRNDRRHGDS